MSVGEHAAMFALQEAREEARRLERERCRRVIDHHLAGAVVDDELAQKIGAMREAIQSGADPRPA